MFSKILRTSSSANARKALMHIVSKLIKADKTFIFENADNLSLFLTLREVYLERFVDGEPIIALEYKLFGEKIKHNVRALKTVISKAT